MADFTDNIILTSKGSATGSPIAWLGGDGVFTATGTFGGATATLQYSTDPALAAGNWINVDQGTDTYVTKTVAGGGRYSLPACNIRTAISGATGTTAIDSSVKVIAR